MDYEEGLADAIAGFTHEAIDLKTQPLKDAIARLQADVASLNAQPRGLKDAGVWRDGMAYQPGDVVTYRGSAWVCNSAHQATASGFDHRCFRLMVKKGADGRDLREKGASS
jgi:Carbohydrate-binding module family 5/12